MALAFTILAGLFGTVGLGGMALIALGTMGIGGGAVAWFAARKIPWRLIAAIACVATIIFGVWGAWTEYQDTKDALISARVSLGKEQLLRQGEKARGDKYFKEHGEQVERIQQLESANRALNEETT